MASENPSGQQLYPPFEEFQSDFLKVSDLHTLHYEQSGNPQGKPVVILHGGPGGGMSPFYRRYFDPAKWHIVQFSQRGCGQSTPFVESAWELSQVWPPANPLITTQSQGIESKTNCQQIARLPVL